MNISRISWIQSILIGLMASGCLAATNPTPVTANSTAAATNKMEWFDHAKLGIFIHWGIYGVNGIDESWSYFNNYLPAAQYFAQLKGFTADKYDPKAWAALIKQSGARYAVITSKHHDGVALWDTKANDLSVPKKTPAGRDVLTPFVDAIRAEGLKVGIYYSLMDWSHPDFPVKSREFSKNRAKWDYRPEQDPARWNRFMDFNFAQYKELSDKYRPDMWYFDGHWWFSAEEWRAQATADLIHAGNPNAIINDRLPGQGDYMTPEQGIPLTNPHKRWETSMTINASWGYQPTDRNYKTPYEVICLFADCLHMGGNMLLDIGPKPDGTIAEQQVKVLQALGRWTSKHEKAIYDTRAGIDLAYYNGPSTLGSSDYLGKTKGGDILYLFVPNKPNGAIRIKGLKNRIMRTWVVGHGAKLNWRQDTDLAHPGIIYLEVPDAVLDQDVTVIAVLLDGPINLQPLEYSTEAPAIAPAGATTGA